MLSGFAAPVTMAVGFTLGIVQKFRQARLPLFSAGTLNGRMPQRVLIVDDHVDTVKTTVARVAIAASSGWDAARTIRQDIPGKRPLLIAVTGEYKGAADLILTKMNGFDHYFLKPTEPAKLAELIENAAA